MGAGAVRVVGKLPIGPHLGPHNPTCPRVHKIYPGTPIKVGIVGHGVGGDTMAPSTLPVYPYQYVLFVLKLVPVSVWEENSDTITYPALIYHRDRLNEIKFDFYYDEVSPDITYIYPEIYFYYRQDQGDDSLAGLYFWKRCPGTWKGDPLRPL